VRSRESQGKRSHKAPRPWSTVLECRVLIAGGYAVPTAAIISEVVGKVLSLVNQGSVTLSGDFSTETWL